ncbi:hypothetical protein QUF75_19715 [Desulfococcaceae bacterium HSG7]|nr:hypothetical protein [Desulfococcaceae bacterium HSG7]
MKSDKNKLTLGGISVNYREFYTQVSQKVAIAKRLRAVAVIYIIFLMSPVRKHTFEAAATFAKSGKSRFG